MRSLPGPPAKEAESGGGDGRQLKRRAFTLIELLVVIAILGTLAALLLPALASAKLRARQIQCLSNVKQLTMASATYGSDHGTLAGYDTAPIPHSLWMGSLNDYYSKVGLLRICPSTRELSTDSLGHQVRGTADQTWAWGWGGTTTLFTGSYAFNGWLYDTVRYGATPFPQYQFRKETAIQRPSETPAFCDSIWVDAWPLEGDVPSRDLYSGFYSDSGVASMGRCTISRHGGRSPASAPREVAEGQKLPGAINAGMADGHAKLENLDSLWNLYWHFDWQPPTTRPR